MTALENAKPAAPTTATPPAADAKVVPVESKPWTAALAPVTATFEEVKHTVTQTARENVQAANDLTGTARHAIKTFGKTAYESVRTYTRPVFHVFEQADSKEGTQLRKEISSIRKSLNEQIYNSEVLLRLFPPARCCCS